MKLEKLIYEGNKILSTCKVDRANYESMLIFSKLNDVKLFNYYLDKDKKISPKIVKLFLKKVFQRSLGKPISKIFGRKEFYSRSFFVNSHTLSPRPESELIIEIIKKKELGKKKMINILDLGCGSGCIGISLYQENPNIILSLADFSKRALSLSKKNALELKAKCEFILSDLFTNISEKFDLIVTNLPYVAKDDFFSLQKEIILYEPHEALYGGVSGLDKIKFFLGNVRRHLNKNGIFVIEFGDGQDVILKQELLRYSFSKFEFHRDLNSVNRLVCVIKDT